MAGAIVGAIISKAIAGKPSSAGGSVAPKVDLNRLFSAGGSTLQGGQLNIDPAVGGLRQNVLDRIGLMSQQGGPYDFGSRFRGLSNEFAGNQGALINARLNPLRAQIAQQGGALQRNLGRRGVQGTFANQAMTNFGLNSGRALGDAQAQATQDALNARTSLLGMEQGAESALTQLMQSNQANMLQQELAKLGLSVNSIQGLLGAQNQAAAVNAPGVRAEDKTRNDINAAFGGTIGEGITNYFNS